MKRFFVLMIGLLVLGICRAENTTADFYVSTVGSDQWSGTLAEPNVAGTDGPFITLERARDAVRKLKVSKKSDITVLVRGGTYPVTKTIVFGLEDSGEGDSSITYAAYPNETPIFSSGHEITGWKKVKGNMSRLPKEAKGHVWVAEISQKFLTLYDEEGMLPRARSEHIKSQKGGSETKLRFPEGRLKNWSNVTDVEVLVRPTRLWIMNVLPLASVDEKAGLAQTTVPATYGMSRYGFWIENILEELNEPGEWVLNTKEGKVYLWPRGKSPVMAPQLIEYILVEGHIDKEGPSDVPVRNLSFRGLTFKHGERFTLALGDVGMQHDWEMLDKANALVRFRGTENCAIEQCHFLDSGSGAIRVDLYGQKNEVSGNHIEHMGGLGVFICGYGPGTKHVSKNNLIYNNDIHHVGEIYWHSAGIYICQSAGNRVANNLIHHTNYNGMTVSGAVTRFFVHRDKRETVRAMRWHEIGDLPDRPERDDVLPYLHTRDNIIEYNEIHHAMQILGDGNGIYVRGCGPGNILRHNYIHHLIGETKAQSGIRTDGGQMDTLITGNLLYKCTSQGMTLKLNNRFENNIIADVIAPRGTYLKIVEGPSTGASNKRNIYYSTTEECSFVSEPGSGKGNVGEDRRGRVTARMKDVDSDDNIYFCKAEPELGEKTLERLRRSDVDAHSKVVDPLFVDPENGDFRFRPNSPALKMGIAPFDMSKVGLRGSDT